jgi:hypothetical protein
MGSKNLLKASKLEMVKAAGNQNWLETRQSA